MDRADALAALNRKILGAYSARTVAALRDSLATRLALPYLEPVLELNIAKEVRKDALVIRRAADAAAAGVRPTAEIAHELFAATKAVDEDFLQRVDSFPVRICIRYEDIEPVRMSRIRYVLHGAHRIFASWTEHTPLRDAMRTAYDEGEFEMLLSVILDLYARETRVVSRSLQLPATLTGVADRAAQHLSKVMADAGTRLAVDVARALYRGKSSPSRPVPGRDADKASLTSFQHAR